MHPANHTELAKLNRRRLLTLVGATGAGLLAGRTALATTPATTPGTSPATTPGTAGADCAVTPSETGGPFPADGTTMGGGPGSDGFPGGAPPGETTAAAGSAASATTPSSAALGADSGAAFNVLADAAFVRADITGDIDGSDVQTGVPLTLRVAVSSAAAGCAPLVGAAVYVWHCSVDGHYSGYGTAMNGGDYTAFSWLRGIQVTGADGAASFTTVLPGRYDGRAFHIHYAVFDDAAYTNRLLTSQMALPDEVVTKLYTDSGDSYATSLANETTNADDNIFSDGVDQQLMELSGDITTGLTAVCRVVVP